MEKSGKMSKIQERRKNRKKESHRGDWKRFKDSKEN